MFDVFIIGYSLSDPDIKKILELAKETRNPAHPIYMVSSEFTPADERELFERCNIDLLRYDNVDGKHSELKRILSGARRFIVRRGQVAPHIPVQVPSEEEVQTASALFLFRKLHLLNFGEDISPLLLCALPHNKEDSINLDQISQSPLKEIINKNRVLVEKNLNRLAKEGMVEVTTENKYWLSQKGRDKIKEFRSIRDTEKDRAFGQLIIDMKKLCVLTPEQESTCLKIAETALIEVFRNRGLIIAKKIYAGRSATPEELADIFGFISEFAGGLSGHELKNAFMEAMYSFVVSPNNSQKEHLASISQGYFIYHFLGLDPNFSKLSIEIFHEILWLCDASTLLPLIANGCYNHEFSISLFEMLKSSKAVLYTTEKLLHEAWKHFEFAVKLVKVCGEGSQEFLRVALVKGTYKQNLFIDGYIRLSAEGKVSSFGEYLSLVSPDGIDQVSFENGIKKRGIQVIELSKLDGFDSSMEKEITGAKSKIQLERQSKGTLRSELQIEAEAEIWELIKCLRTGKLTLPERTNKEFRCYFVSHSRILDQVSSQEEVTTWSPEALYRYLFALPKTQLSTDLLQQCMLDEYYYAGVSFIDKERYLRFFEPNIEASKLSFQQEKGKYIAEIEKTNIKETEEAFEKTPDLEKAFFVAQMGWRLAESAKKSEEIALKKAAEMEAKLKELESEKEAAWKIKQKRASEQEGARLRNLMDPKHIRKRLRQAKKRRKK